MNNLLTVLIALSKICVIYARSRKQKQAFQAAVVVIMMIIIIKNEQSKKKQFYGKYKRVDQF